MVYLRQQLVEAEAKLAKYSQKDVRLGESKHFDAIIQEPVGQKCAGGLHSPNVGDYGSTLWTLLDCRDNIQSSHWCNGGQWTSVGSQGGLADQIDFGESARADGTAASSLTAASRISTVWVHFLYLRLGSIPIRPKWEEH